MSPQRVAHLVEVRQSTGQDPDSVKLVQHMLMFARRPFHFEHWNGQEHRQALSRQEEWWLFPSNSWHWASWKAAEADFVVLPATDLEWDPKEPIPAFRDLRLRRLLEQVRRAANLPPERLSWTLRALVCVLNQKIARISGIQQLSSAEAAYVEDYVLAHLEEPLTLSTLGALLGLSGDTLARRYKAINGETLHQAILRLRLGRARDLVERTNLPLAVIASETGFYDQSHLNKAFRECYLIPPGELRVRALARAGLP